ncbi:hypothetical protein ACRRHK_000866 [Vibrio fluvialis]
MAAAKFALLKFEITLLVEGTPIGKYHQNKEINQAIEDALLNGWLWFPSAKGHCKGRLKCIEGHGEHMFSVWSTPKNAENHAKDIRRLTSKCPK